MADVMVFARALAEIAAEAASMILEPDADAAGLDADPAPQWALEWRWWERNRGTTEPMLWVGEATSAYITEAAHQVRAISVLLHTGVVTAALDPLARAVVERVGRVKWILDHTITAEQRGARGALELGVSMAAYRRGLGRAKSPARGQWAKNVRAHRERISKVFDVDQPPSDPCDETSAPSKEMSAWTVAGELYPSYGSNAGYALETEHVGRVHASAWYDGLSGFSHPSVVFSREHRTVGEAGGLTYTYQPADLEKVTRVAAFGLLDAGRYWTSYYGADPDGFQQHVDDLGDIVDSISVVSKPST